MPVSAQAFTSKIETWKKKLGRDSVPTDMSQLFGQEEEVTLSRGDILEIAATGELLRTVFAAILWGYPYGMRNNYFARIVDKLPRLEKLLGDATNEGNVDAWSEHSRETKDIYGLGLSTYSKFLYFLGVKVCGHPALILDGKIQKVLKEGVFDELGELQNKPQSNPRSWYPDYLEVMDAQARRLGVAAGNLEMFLFTFGGILK